ncbi:SGNH/GDSL hydrolase family protein [Amycolatopsis sp. PS_44_ISF1]|uniref:SGNH/GDSL hydrolase family protein n=1 Tax=Amycolatopsis sp. PS_44_ISF1 TaxID=2974917 RepID=UPI0028E06F62|nr:SGNH/GDSL hydrolase family protein [Amycolatopsis sp. PS_44_ISF1]MDT8913007.1 SGNH/GDSL hydrolase family protein [Amycolatopsis sp. PS_44_ISF1]
MSRRAFAAVTAGVTALSLAVAGPADARPAVAATGAWAAAPVAGQTLFGCPGGDGGLQDQTVRNIVYPSVGGSKVRVRLSNQFGTAPLVVPAASVGVVLSGARLVPGSSHPLTFGGSKAVTVVPGSSVLSDWLDLPVQAHQELAVSVYVPQLHGPATEHPSAQQDNFVSKTGDWSAAEDSGGYPATIPCWLFASGVDVQPESTVAGSVVGFGDSITDGANSAVNANDRWPDELGRRLHERPGRTLSVVNEGIGGNQVLQDSGLSGVSALARFDRDVLGQPGVRAVIVLEGVNDIGASDLGTRPHLAPDELIAAYRQLIARAHAAGVRVYGATLLPFKGAFYWSEDGERTRAAVNDWIRHGGEFDGTADFAAAVANPADPQVYDPQYDSGDHLHPGDAGYRAMARAVDLSMLVRGATGPRPTSASAGR